jgi:serine/threonine protein kinase
MDVKLENMVCRSTEDNSTHVTLIDFEYAIVLPSANAHRILMSARGTIGYIAPELLNKRMVGLKSDVWSMACVLMYAVCQREFTRTPYTRLIAHDAEQCRKTFKKYWPYEPDDTLASALNVSAAQRPSMHALSEKLASLALASCSHIDDNCKPCPPPHQPISSV